MATYTELRTLFRHPVLTQKVEVACLIAAEAIRTEDVGTSNHANRLLWAKRVFASPHTTAEMMLMALLAANFDAPVATITNVTDAAMQTQVNNAVNLFADGS